MEIKVLLENLSKEITYKWKIQSVPKEKNGVWKKWNCVAYIDSRDCQSALDKYCEEGWQSDFYEVKWKVFCKVGIKINGEWQWRSDSGALESNDNVEEETTSKWETSDAFKRACVQWGIWRFLYEKDIIWISHEEYEVNRFKINDFCKSKEWKKAQENTKSDTPTWWTAIKYFWVKDLERCEAEWFAISKEAIKSWASDNWLTIWKPLQDVIIKYLETWEITQPVFNK